LHKNIGQYKNASFIWAQEEPKNQGAHDFASVRINNYLEQSHGGKRIKYAGRQISASTATGYGKNHVAELASLLKDAFTL